MKNLRNLFFVLAILVIGTSCTITQPITASTASVGDKLGRSETGVLFGSLYLNGNYGMQEAVENGNISGGVATVDSEYTYHPFAFIYYKRALIVGGE